MGTENEGAGEANAAAASDPKKDSLYEDRPTSKKIIRVVTVVAYMVSVSFVAIVLSAYYVFLWQPPNPRLLHRDHLRADPQMEYLVDKPPTEVTMNESLSPTEIRDKVNVFREEILRSRGVNISFRSQHQEQPESLEKKSNYSKISRVDRVITNGAKRNDSQTHLNSIGRTFLGTTETPTTQITLGNSTDVYKSINVAMKRSSVTDSLLRAPTVFIETQEINGYSSTTSSSSSPSSSSSSSLPESKDKLYNVSMNDIVSTTATASVTGNRINVEENRNFNRISEKFNSVRRPSIKGINPTRAYELLENLGSTKAGLDRVGSSTVDQHIGDTTIGISGAVEKKSDGNVGSFAESRPPQIRQSLEKIITTSGRRRENLSKALETTTHPNIIGSLITRVSIKSSTNNTELQDKLPTNFPPEKELPIEIVPDPTEELEPVLNSAASVVPAVVQPDPESIGKEQESKEQFAQDGDFAFI